MYVYVHHFAFNNTHTPDTTCCTRGLKCSTCTSRVSDENLPHDKLTVAGAGAAIARFCRSFSCLNWPFKSFLATRAALCNRVHEHT